MILATSHVNVGAAERDSDAAAGNPTQIIKT